MLLRVDPTSEVPLFEQLASSIRASAIDGTLPPGERLPSARELARSLEINVHTVLRAYQIIRDEGLIELRRGRGAIASERTRDYSALSSAIAVVIAEARAHDISASALTAMIREAFQ